MLLNTNISNRKYLTIIDGIIGGEKEAPLEPSPIKSGVTVAAFNPAVSDFVATRIMGIDPNKVPIVKNSFLQDSLPIFDENPEEIEVKCSDEFNNINDFLLAGS